MFAGLTGIHAVGTKGVWAFGKRGKVLRYDGGRWQSLPVADGASVTALWASEPHEAWVATHDGGAYWWRGERWQRMPVRPKRALVGMWGGRQTLWGITAEGELAALRAGTWRVVRRLISQQRRVLEMLLDIKGTSDDDVWVSTSAGRLIHWDGSSTRVYTSTTAGELSSIAAVSPDYVWAYNGWTILRFRRR
jgi:hypothetical protein